MKCSELENILDLMDALRLSGASISEQSYRVTIKGNKLCKNQAYLLASLGASLALSTPDTKPAFMVDGVSEQLQGFKEEEYLGAEWQLVFAKDKITSELEIRETEQTFIFFSITEFNKWLNDLDPFKKNSTLDPNFREPVTIKINGLKKPFGSSLLWFTPISQNEISEKESIFLPSEERINSVVHISGFDEAISIIPQAWSLTWGDPNSESAHNFLKKACLVLASSLVNDVKTSDNTPSMVTIRGNRKITLPLWNKNSELNWEKLHGKLMDAVLWVYEERPETRLKLVLDRITLDLVENTCLLESFSKHLPVALTQAKDSYTFVILDRKDEYYKEMREIMKDMKSQADYYAEKTRSLANALSRDFLGILLFIVLSFIGKFDRENIKSLINSSELSIFTKILCIYLILSLLLQLAIAIRDDNLSFNEAKRWLRALRNHIPSSEVDKHFLGPIELRRSTLHVAMIISSVLYGILVAAVLSMPLFMKILLN